MNNQIFKTTSILALFTLVVRILGFKRDAIIAEMFGVTATVDAFFAANKLLTSLRGFVEIPLSQIFVPILSEYRKKYSHAEERKLLSKVTGTLCFCVFILVCIGILFVPYLIKLSAPGLEPYRFNLAIRFLRLTLPYLLFVSFCGLGIAVMNTYDKPLVVASTPIWLSISFISAAIWLSPYFEIPIIALAWGVLFGGVLQISFMLIFLKRVDLLVLPRIDFYDPGVLRVIKRLLPAALGASAAQVSLLINTNLASFLPVGTISWIYYADRLIYFPLSVIGISLSIALLRPLSQYYAEGNIHAFKKTLGWGLRTNILVAIPASISIAMLAGPFIVTLLMRGEFNTNDVIETQKALLGYVVGIPAFMLSKTLVSSFYTQQDTRTPIKVVAAGALVNIAVGLLLIPKLQQTGITFANSINSWVQVSLMLFWLNQPLNTLFSPPQGFKRWITSVVIMTISLLTFLYIATPPLETWLAWSKTERYIRLSLLGLGTFTIVGLSASYSGDFRQSTANEES